MLKVIAVIEKPVDAKPSELVDAACQFLDNALFQIDGELPKHPKVRDKSPFFNNYDFIHKELPKLRRHQKSLQQKGR